MIQIEALEASTRAKNDIALILCFGRFRNKKGGMRTMGHTRSKPKANRPAKQEAPGLDTLPAYTFADWKAGKPIPKGWGKSEAHRNGWADDQIFEYQAAFWDKIGVPLTKSGGTTGDQAPKPSPKTEPPAAKPKPRRADASLPAKRSDGASEPPQDDAPWPTSQDDYSSGDLVEIKRGGAAKPVPPSALDLPPLGHPEFDRAKAEAWKKSRGIVSYAGGDAAKLLEWVFLEEDGKFFSKLTGGTTSKAAFDLSKQQFVPSVHFFGDKEGEWRRHPASVTLASYLPGGRSVRTRMYRPDVPDPIIEYKGAFYANSYLAHMVPEVDPKWRDHDAWKIVRDHIHDIFPDGAEIIIKWMAHNVQHPGVKIRWSPVLVGVQGDGKTVFAKKCLQSAMGGNVKDVSPEEIFSEFSAWAEGACVRVMEEIRIRGEHRASAMEKPPRIVRSKRTL
jgi:hypothetical protein